MELKKYYRKAFWQSLSSKSYIKLLLAIFFTMSTIGFIIDLWNAGQQPLWRLLITILYFGFLGVGCAHIAIRRDWKILPVLVVIQFSIMFLIPESTIQIQIFPSPYSTVSNLTTGSPSQQEILCMILGDAHDMVGRQSESGIDIMATRAQIGYVVTLPILVGINKQC